MRGGASSAGNVRLLCRAHNQYEAERTFGVDFMRAKREEAIAARAAREWGRPGAALARVPGGGP